ncbi:MAG: hypothetical protein O2800_05635 [Planctomycetota bacterium]|nr:hypothetical protein [Planctomycetota bacterium]
MTRAIDEHALVTVRHAANEVEAGAIRAVLVDEGIEAWIFAAPLTTLGFGASAESLGGIPVQVRLGELGRAKTVLRENEMVSESLDWDSVDVGAETDEVQAASSGSTAVVTLGRILVRIGMVFVFLLLVVLAVGGVGAIFAALRG